MADDEAATSSENPLAAAGPKLTKDQGDFLMAAGLGKKGTMESLLGSGSVDVNVKSSTKGMTALMAATGGGHKDCVAALLEKNADCTVTTSGDQLTKGMVALHFAADLESKDIAEMLVKAKPDTVNTVDEDGNSPLHLAAYGGRKAVVELLLANSADKELKDSQGMTAKDAAEKQGHGDVAALL